MPVLHLLAGPNGAGKTGYVHDVLVPVELTVQRVVERVRRGGHAVPEQKMRDRSTVDDPHPTGPLTRAAMPPPNTPPSRPGDTMGRILL